MGGRGKRKGEKGGNERGEKEQKEEEVMGKWKEGGRNVMKKEERTGGGRKNGKKYGSDRMRKNCRKKQERESRRTIW